jgi:hypothetical protein
LPSAGSTQGDIKAWQRYDWQVAVEAINDLYRHELRLWLNLYLPSVKLSEERSLGIESATRL